MPPQNSPRDACGRELADVDELRLAEEEDTDALRLETEESEREDKEPDDGAMDDLPDETEDMDDIPEETDAADDSDDRDGALERIWPFSSMRLNAEKDIVSSSFCCMRARARNAM